LSVSQVPPPSGVQPRPSAEGEAGGREEFQLTTQSPDRPKEGEEGFNSSLGLISLAGTNFNDVKYQSHITPIVKIGVICIKN